MGTTSTGRRSAARERLLETAGRVFYAKGIHAISVDEVIVEADVSRATFYRHFPGKEDLVRAYLQEEDRAIRERVAKGAEVAADPRELLHLLVLGLGEQICGAGFRGCPFINAAAEYPDPAHPVREVVREHRTWFLGAITELVAAIGHPNPEQAARSVVMLRDGAMVGGYLDDPKATGDSLAFAVDAVTTNWQ
jgi:AcrR family transcriptional regulator